MRSLLAQGLGPQAVTANHEPDNIGHSLVQAANTFAVQGKDLDAIRTLLNVPATSEQAQVAAQKFANLIHIELGQSMGQELNAISLQKPPGKAKRSLAGLGVSYLSDVETKTDVDKVQTKLGYSSISVYRPDWPEYRQPTDADYAADPHSWYDPWSESYQIAPGVTIEVMYGCKSNKVLQTTATFNRNNVSPQFIEARFNRLLQGSHQRDIQLSQTILKRVIQRQENVSTEEFRTDQVRGWILIDQDQLRIVTRKA